MPRTRQEIQAALGANNVQAVQAPARTPFGVLRLCAEMADRLQPGLGSRPGRPVDPVMEI